HPPVERRDLRTPRRVAEHRQDALEAHLPKARRRGAQRGRRRRRAAAPLVGMNGEHQAELVRPRLIRRLREATQHPVTVITAPAGYGKSVLVDQWASKHDGLPLARLNIRPNDDWPRAAARLDEVLPSSGEAVLVIDGVDRSTDEVLTHELATLVERVPP